MFSKPAKYHWESKEYNQEEDEFLKHFDEDGNFIEFLPEEEIQEQNDIQIIYNYKEAGSFKNYTEEE